MSVGFNDNTLDEIKSRCNIVDVIGRKVPLKKTGSNYKGICPFHNEKTPSFVVSDTKQIFTCFGCGATGDVIEFVQKYNNVEFSEAIEYLAKEYGIELKGSGYESEGNKAALYEINREAAAYFYRCFTKKPNPAYQYMKKRGIEDITLKKFGIGYADGQWDSLYHYLKEKGIDESLMLELGLISESKGKYYDKFRDRVIFPIINTRGKVIGFGGRSLGEGMPKYLNSPESVVFLKKNNLYGLNLTRQDINKENCAILVEGYMDVISLYQNGVRNVSASLGTALTENQGSMLKRYTDNIILSYDADEAGHNASLRGLEILHKAGCKVKVLHISEGKDPDEFIKKNGREEFLKLIDKAMPYAEYKIHVLREKSDIETTDGSVEFLQESAKILKELSPVEADVYIKKIASETKISEGAIRLEIYGNNITDNIREKTNFTVDLHGKSEQKQRLKADGSGSMLEKNLIKLMLLKSSYVPKIIPYKNTFRNKSTYRIFELIKSVYNEDEEIDIKKVEDSLEPDDIALLQDINENVQIADKEEQIFQDCINKIESAGVAKREQEIIKILSVLDDDLDNKEIEELTKELMELQKAKNKYRR